MNIDEQKLALDHLYYEVWMLHESFKLWEQNSSQLEFNIYTELLLIHTRNLIYFLEDRLDERDIRCSDFGIEKIIVCFPQDINLEKIDILIDKFVSHLTWDRIRKKKPEWSYKVVKEIVTTIIKKISTFVNKLSDDLFPTTRYNKTKCDFAKLKL
jgi:hypothetical protein